ncbi:replication protein A 14 kDa subunit-like [Actinia tenebrosa]|uniref:Replication protein A 14 kDa subunit-like n=1 Tax=Actinia tenebrosa TaxID=6105 RepID=A0A6P8HN99_ACTTE|nr:replication protein A 14 kDa subunit-like [Actinia tenebrosa]
MEAPRVNASMLRQYAGRLVCLVAKISEINNTGTELKVLTSDDKTIHVILSEPLEEALQGVIEIIGRAEKDGTISAQRLISYNGSEEFDMNLYNEAVKLTTNFPEIFAGSNANGFA